MFSIILTALALAALTVALHVAGITILLVILRKNNPLTPTRFWPILRLLIGMNSFLILLHLAEILIWAFFYQWWGHMPDMETAVYFSAVTYTTIGYGDVVLIKPWRLLAPIEGLAGILMCGLSTAFFFAVVMGIHQSRHPKS